MHGFLATLLKTELELSNGSQAETAAIIENFQNIRTIGDARAYAQQVAENAEHARALRANK